MGVKVYNFFNLYFRMFFWLSFSIIGLALFVFMIFNLDFLTEDFETGNEILNKLPIVFFPTLMVCCSVMFFKEFITIIKNKEEYKIKHIFEFNGDKRRKNDA